MQPDTMGPRCSGCRAYQLAGLGQGHWSWAWLPAQPRGLAKGRRWGWTGTGLKPGGLMPWMLVAGWQRRCRLWHPAKAPAEMGPNQRQFDRLTVARTWCTVDSIRRCGSSMLEGCLLQHETKR